MNQFVTFVRHHVLLGLTKIGLAAGLALEAAHHVTAAHAVVGTIAVTVAACLLYRMLQNARNGSYGSNILAIIGVVCAVLINQAWAALVLVSVLTVTDWLVTTLHERLSGRPAALQALLPASVRIVGNRKIVDAKIASLKISDKISLNAGDRVAADGVIIDGDASFDESEISGDIEPHVRKAGETVLAGSLVAEGSCIARVSALPRDSQLYQLIRIIQVAQQSDSPFIRLAERFTIPFSVMVLAVAGAAYIVTGQWLRFLDIILVASPLPLLISAPLGLHRGLVRASQMGIFIKNGSILERYADVETLILDGRASLINGISKVTDVLAYGHHKPQDILVAAASISQPSSQSSTALEQAASDQSLKLVKTKHIRSITDQGFTAQLHGHEVLVGSLVLLKDQGVSIPKQFKPSEIKQSAVYVAIGHSLAGVIMIEETIRKDAQTVIARLHTLGVKRIELLSNQPLPATKHFAQKLGLTNYHTDMSPTKSLQLLESKRTTSVACVGDGVTSASLFTASDIGIAIGARGSVPAGESANVIVLSSDLQRVATGLAIASRTLTVARRSIAVGIAVSLGLMAAFATGKFSPILGAGLQSVVVVVSLISASRS